MCLGRQGSKDLRNGEQNFNLYGDRGIYRLGYVNGGTKRPRVMIPKSRPRCSGTCWDGVSQSVVWNNIADTNLPRPLPDQQTGSGGFGVAALWRRSVPMASVIPAETRFLSR
jgi:hypothetical protein